MSRRDAHGAVDWHLAQLNIGRLLHPLDAAETKGFVDELEPVNALADAAPGFVWRLQTDEGDATAIQLFDDDLMIVNLSVWESVEALRAFLQSGRHLEVMRRRRSWFVRLGEAHLVLWWIPAGRAPTPAEALARLEVLRRNGPTVEAFTLRRVFSPDGVPIES